MTEKQVQALATHIATARPVAFYDQTENQLTRVKALRLARYISDSGLTVSLVKP